MLCTDIPAPIFLIFSSDAPHLLYYSHIPTALISLFLWLFVFYRNNRSLEAKLLLLVSFLFSLWSFCDLILWTNIDSRLIMFVWSLINLLEILISFATAYFAHSLIEKRDVSFNVKLIAGALLAIFLVFVPTSHNIEYFDIANCEARQGNLMIYYFLLQGVVNISLLVFLARKIMTAGAEERKKIIYFSVGVLCFIATFTGANIIGNISATLFPDNPENWKILQYGLFGMPVFTGLLGYLIVRYHVFHIELLTAQALVAALILLIGSQFFFIQNSTNRFLTAITLILASAFGWWLVRSVKKIFKQRVELANAYSELKKLDEAKSDFISIASHQLRTPLTVIKGYVSMMLEGNFGRINIDAENALSKVYESNERLIRLVENLLNISRIEAGRLTYIYDKNVDVRSIAQSVCQELSQYAKEKKLKLLCVEGSQPLPLVTADAQKLRQVLLNLVDNALKYTRSGTVQVDVRQKDENIVCTVKDTGTGFSPAEKRDLFKRFSRGKRISLVYTEGTGLGLYVAKIIIKEHGGKVWAESPGPGKGSTFGFQIPIRSDPLAANRS